MKIILSRKGFDTQYGGDASPILPDGKMLSLPIPLEDDSLSYNSITAPGGKCYAEIMKELGVKKLDADGYIESEGAHLDPDLVESVRSRSSGWRPAFGQNSGAETHLRNQGVTKGDLFLFFSWYRHSEITAGDLSYFGNRKSGFHAIFGYMQIGEIIPADEDTEFPSWLQDHPHTMPAHTKYNNNTIYVATPTLSFHPNYPGGGAFYFDERLRLTKKGESRLTPWNLNPKIFRHLTFSCDENKKKEEVWKEEYYQSPAYPCQEIVIPEDDGVSQWASDLITSSRIWLD